MDDVLCAVIKKLNIPIPDIGTRPSKTEQSSHAVNEAQPSKTEQSSNAVNETQSSKTAGQTKIQLSNAGTEADTQCTTIDSHITHCT